MDAVYVLIERDLADDDVTVVGVVDSVENSEKFMGEYYGSYELLKHEDIRDSGIEWVKTINIEFDNTVFSLEVSLEWFELNKC